MNPEPAPNDRPPHTETEPKFHRQSPLLHYDVRPTSATTITYFIDEQPRRSNFLHDKPKGLFVLTKSDGTTEQFRDKPVGAAASASPPTPSPARALVRRLVNHPHRRRPATAIVAADAVQDQRPGAVGLRS